ncbi:Chitin synthase 8 [Sesbania bispinosa]|nr:Chitin synthase 8 [Sesbania bispinosa]
MEVYVKPTMTSPYTVTVAKDNHCTKYRHPQVSSSRTTQGFCNFFLTGSAANKQNVDTATSSSLINTKGGQSRERPTEGVEEIDRNRGWW